MIRRILPVLISIILAATVHAQSPSPSPGSCLFNTTHCACSTVQNPGTCLRQTGMGQCETAQCSSLGLMCDCMGTWVCTISSCNAYLALDGTPTSAIPLNTAVQCQMGTVDWCLSKVAKFRMVQFGAASATAMFNMTAFTDDGTLANAIANQHTDDVATKWPMVSRLSRRFITMRLYEAAAGERMLCAIYNKFGVGSDGQMDMEVDVTITGNDGQQLEWVACDDETQGECPGGPGAVLEGKHYLVSTLSDGWCVRPLAWDGKVVSVDFTRVRGMKGVIFQSVESDRVFLFSDGANNGMTGSVSGGIVNVGTVPKIQFSLQGLEFNF